MKKVSIFICSIFLLGNSYFQEPAQIERLSWLLGSWEGSNNNEEKQSFEVWTKVSDTKYLGIGYAMKGSDTTFLEKLEIVERDGDLFYVADVTHNKTPIYFKMKTVNDSMFVAENPLHDFPKNIAYRKEGINLYAQVWNEKNRIDFSFVRKAR